MQAEAKGILEILSKQAEGFDKIVKAAGDNSKDAVLLMIADKLPELVKTQVEAIKNIKIDKVTVWDSNSNKDGNATSGFLSGLAKSLPPMDDLFKMAGMELPSFLQGKTQDVSVEEVKESKTEKPKSSQKAVVKQESKKTPNQPPSGDNPKSE